MQRCEACNMLSIIRKEEKYVDCDRAETLAVQSGRIPYWQLSACTTCTELSTVRNIG